jgi:Skp family chaperone for outer membrane proteins
MEFFHGLDSFTKPVIKICINHRRKVVLMSNIKQLAARTVLGLALFVTFAANANAQKIGVIDSRQVLEALPETQAANAKVQALQKMWQDSLVLMQTALQNKADGYKKILDTMNPESKEKANAELTSLNDALLKYRDAKFGQDGELAHQQQIILQPIFDRTKEAIALFAKRDKFVLIVDKNAVLNADGAVDLTQKMIEYLKSGKSGK